MIGINLNGELRQNQRQVKQLNFTLQRFIYILLFQIMNKPNNTQFHKNKYNKQYGLTAPVSPRQQGNKFQRKPHPQPKARVQAASKQRKMRAAEESAKDHTLRYISSANDKDDCFRGNRSNSISGFPSQLKHNNNTSFNPLHHRIKNCKLNVQDGNNQTMNDGRNCKMRTKTISDFHQSPAFQIEQLKLTKKNLTEQIRQLRQKVDMKDKLIDKLEININNKDKKIQQLEQQMNELLSKYEMLMLQNQEQRQTIENYETTFNEKEDEKKSVQTRQDLERILSDINRGFDQISLDSKLQEESRIVGQPRLEQVIVNLHEKIKYQDIEIMMLKKAKYNFGKMEAQIEKLQIQNRILSKRLKNVNQKTHEEQRKLLEVEKKQNCFDYSISFQLSRDEESKNY